MTLLKATKVHKKGQGEFLLANISFSQRKLEKIAIAGETGAGKSTLLKMIAGLIQPDGGELLFEKKKIIGPDDQLVPGHPGIAYLSQHFELQKSLRVEQVLAYANILSEELAERLYKVCRINHLLGRRTDQLSGGEKQRVAICRLLISSPRLLLLDEPFSHLDMAHKNMLKSVVRDIGEELGITCMLVSHDPLDTLSWADKIMVMKDGKIIQKATPEIIYHQPVDEYTSGLFGKHNIIRPGNFEVFSVIKSFRKFMGQAGTRKSIMIRPEQFQLVKKNAHAVRAKVRNVLFLGSYREAEIEVAENIFTIRTCNESIREGQTVHISISNDQLWRI